MKLHRETERLWELITVYKRRQKLHSVSYQLQGGEHFANQNSIGDKDHFVPENVRHAYRTAPGKHVNGDPMEMRAGNQSAR